MIYISIIIIIYIKGFDITTHQLIKYIVQYIYIYVTHVYFLLNPLFFCLSPFLPWSPVTLLAHSVKPVKRQVGEREGDEETEGRWDQPFGCDQNHGKLMGDPPLGWDVWDPPSQ